MDVRIHKIANDTDGNIVATYIRKYTGIIL